MPGAGLHHRQQHAHASALAALAIHHDGALVAAQDAMRRRHAQAAPGELGGEKGLEHAPQRVGIHAAARVAHFQPNETSGRRLALQQAATQVGLVANLLAGAEGDRARLLADGFRGVGDQVHHHLLDLPGIGQHQRKLRARVQFERHVGRDHGSEQGGALSHPRAQVKALGGDAPFARVGQQLARELGSARCGFPRALNPRQRGRALGQLVARQLQIARKGQQEVVEIVRHASRQHAQAFQLLRPQKLPLHLHALLLRTAQVADVHHAHQHARQLALAAGQQQTPEQDALLFPRQRACGVLALEDLLALCQGNQLLGKDLVGLPGGGPV